MWASSPHAATTLNDAAATTSDDGHPPAEVLEIGPCRMRIMFDQLCSLNLRAWTLNKQQITGGW